MSARQRSRLSRSRAILLPPVTENIVERSKSLQGRLAVTEMPVDQALMQLRDQRLVVVLSFGDGLDRRRKVQFRGGDRISLGLRPGRRVLLRWWWA
jgi:hypothetical protein